MTHDSNNDAAMTPDPSASSILPGGPSVASVPELPESVTSTQSEPKKPARKTKRASSKKRSAKRTQTKKAKAPAEPAPIVEPLQGIEPESIVEVQQDIEPESIVEAQQDVEPLPTADLTEPTLNAESTAMTTANEDELAVAQAAQEIEEHAASEPVLNQESAEAVELPSETIIEMEPDLPENGTPISDDVSDSGMESEPELAQHDTESADQVSEVAEESIETEHSQGPAPSDVRLARREAVLTKLREAKQQRHLLQQARRERAQERRQAS